MFVEVLLKTLDVQIQLARILQHVPFFEMVLVVEKKIVHLPELALRACSLCRFCGEARVRVDRSIWEMAEYQSHRVAGTL